jgi:hypothetical protein
MDTASLGALTLSDPAGAPHRLDHLWAQQPIVLVFLRHFG